MSNTTTITITSRMNPEPVTVRVMSNCHNHDYEWVPEPDAPMLTARRSMELADNRPGAVPHGIHPVQPDASPTQYRNPKLRAHFKVHWNGNDRCPTRKLVLTSGSGQELSVLNGRDFDRHLHERLVVCSWCRRAFNEA